MISSDQRSPKISSEILTGQPDRRFNFGLPATLDATKLTCIMQLKLECCACAGSAIPGPWREDLPRGDPSGKTREFQDTVIAPNGPGSRCRTLPLTEPIRTSRADNRIVSFA